MHLILNPSDIYFLSSVRPHDPGEIMILHDTSSKKMKKDRVFCDARTSACFDVKKFEIIDDRSVWGSFLGQEKTLSTDPDFLTQSLREKIEGFGVTLTMEKSPIMQERILKKPHEIEIIRASQSMNKQVCEMILSSLVPGVTEEAIARKIQIFQLELGASGPSFPPIVAFGKNTAIPHHSPTERKLRPDDIILLDMGLIYQGYCSDMTRCLVLRDIETEKVTETQVKLLNDFESIYQLLQNVTNSIVSWAKPGMKMSELDKKARQMLGEYEPYFTHSLGHGVGIDIHEAPHVSSKSDEILIPGMIITIEPGIYIAGKYGARYEEMCLVTEQNLEVL